MDSDDSNDEIDGYVDLQDYTHSSTDVHIQEETTDYEDSILQYILFGHAPVSGTLVNDYLRPRGTRRVKWPSQ